RRNPAADPVPAIRDALVSSPINEAHAIDRSGAAIDCRVVCPARGAGPGGGNEISAANQLRAVPLARVPGDEQIDPHPALGVLTQNGSLGRRKNRRPVAVDLAARLPAAARL